MLNTARISGQRNPLDEYSLQEQASVKKKFVSEHNWVACFLHDPYCLSRYGRSSNDS